MSKVAQDVQRAVDALQQDKGEEDTAPDPAAEDSDGQGPEAEATNDDVSGMMPGETATAETEGGGDGMAKKKGAGKRKRAARAKAERKPRERKAKAPREPRAARPVRTGKKGLLLVTWQGLPFVVSGLQMLLKEGELTEEQKPVVEHLLARARARL